MMKFALPVCFMCVILLLSCGRKKNFAVRIDKKNPSLGDTTAAHPLHSNANVFFIYFEDGEYDIAVNGISKRRDRLHKNQSNISGTYECRQLKQNDVIKIEFDNYNPIEFPYDDRYDKIYLWKSGRDSLLIEYTNELYLFD